MLLSAEGCGGYKGFSVEIAGFGRTDFAQDCRIFSISLRAHTVSRVPR